MLPDMPGPHPTVVFIYRSGQQTRNSHRSLAAHFVNQGIACLIYDKRGCGDSDGNWIDLLDLEQSFTLLARDAVSGLNFLREQVEIDADHTGYFGFSQGGWLGPLAASTRPDPAFVICVSGPGVTPYEQVVFTIGNQMTAAGLRTEEIDHALSEMASASDLGRHIAATGEGWVALNELFARMSGSRWSSWVPPFSLVDVDNLESLHPFIEVLRRDPEYRYDPVPPWRISLVHCLPSGARPISWSRSSEVWRCFGKPWKSPETPTLPCGSFLRRITACDCRMDHLLPDTWKP